MEKRPSKSWNDQQNREAFEEEVITLNEEKAKEYAPNVNQIPKNTSHT